MNDDVSDYDRRIRVLAGVVADGLRLVMDYINSTELSLDSVGDDIGLALKAEMLANAGDYEEIEDVPDLMDALKRTWFW